MKATITFGAAFLATALLSACDAQPPSEPATEAAPAEASEAATLSSTDSLQITSGDFGPRDEMPGAPLYEENCAQCHDGTVPKAPHLIWLEMMTPKTLLAAMNDGIMRPQAAHLSALERQQVSEYITRTRSDDAEPTPIPWCEDRALASDTQPRAIGWGHDTNRNTTLADGGIPREQVANLTLKWSFVYPGALRARSQPSVGWGSVFSGSQDGTV
jgi:polyvinyl alcohol dehydrogenase (cytochrome)